MSVGIIAIIVNVPHFMCLIIAECTIFRLIYFISATKERLFTFFNNVSTHEFPPVFQAPDI